MDIAQPLDGILVIDFSQAFSGPFCAMNMADQGARVIKIEREGISIGDIIAGLYAYMAITTVLYGREKSGNGTFIDIGMNRLPLLNIISGGSQLCQYWKNLKSIWQFSSCNFTLWSGLHKRWSNNRSSPWRQTLA
ncbi:MAG: hypothetical protein A2X47_09770 [Lentisphaerae bacterium GWF2_38_69]|nr:MAG: hypothetical protein A2X47_09770 [Lentisphaerae bacterium GWF2_38_69]